MIGKDEYKKDSWYVQVSYKDPLTGKRVQKKKRGFATKRDAKKYEAELIQSASLATTKTFHQISEELLDRLESAPETAQAKRASFKLRFPMYEQRMDKITKKDLNEWRTWLSKQECSYRTKEKTLSYVKSVFAYYSAIYAVPDITIGVLTPFKKQIKEETLHVWTPEQFYQYLDCVDGLLYQLAFETLYWTGMRRGELLALQKTDLVENRITIRGSMKHFKAGIKATKNQSSIRTITIPASLVKKLQCLYDVPGDFLFGGERSISISNLQRRHDNAIKESGVPPIRIHDLRHSHASYLISQNANVAYISKRLGHATIEQTLTTYAHLYQKTEQEGDKLVDKLFKKANEKKTNFA